MVFFTDEDIDKERINSFYHSDKQFITDPVQYISQQILDRFPDHKQYKESFLDDVSLRNDVFIKVIFCPSIESELFKDVNGNEHILLERWSIIKRRCVYDNYSDNDNPVFQYKNFERHSDDRFNLQNFQELLCSLPLNTSDRTTQSRILYGTSTEPYEEPEGILNENIIIKSASLDDDTTEYYVSVDYSPILPLFINNGKVIIDISETSVPMVFCDHSEKDCLSPVPRMRVIAVSDSGSSTCDDDLKCKQMKQMSLLETQHITSKKSDIILKHTSKPIPVPISSNGSESNCNITSTIPGMSPRYPTRKRSKSTICIRKSRYRDSCNDDDDDDDDCTTTARYRSLSPYSNSIDIKGSFAGSLQESLLSGHMPRTKSSIFSGFSASISSQHSKYLSPSQHLRVPFDAYYYHLEDCNKTPYAGSICIPKERYRIAPSGNLQVTLSNPTGTPIKIFFVRYDVSSMKPNSKTFLRQITRNADPPKILQYAIHFSIICTKHGRFYLYKNIRVVFPHRKPDDQNILEVFCQTPDTPQTFQKNIFKN